MPHDETIRLLRERIFHFAASRLSRDAADDVTQEAMLVLHEKYPYIDEPADLLPLAFQIVRFKMAGALRKSVRRGEGRALRVEDVPLAASGDDPERAAARSEMRDRLLAVVATLGDRCREIFQLKLQGRGFEDIRRHFGVASINTIYTWDARCRKSMLDKLGGRWETLP